MDYFDDFQKQVETSGLRAVKRSIHHWQIIGGALLVNFYPTKNKIYVAGTTEGFIGNAAAAISAANRIPFGKIEKEERKHPSYYGKHRKRLLSKCPYCHWCQKPLDQKTATIDHKVPLFRGGMNHSNNFVLACEPCNQNKGNKIWKKQQQL